VEHDIELTVREAHARIDGDTARLQVATDRGRVTLRMHRLVLAALGGSIARALLPKVGDAAPALADAESEAQGEPRDPVREPFAVEGPDLQDVPTQPASPDAADDSVGVDDGPALQDVPTQPASPEPEREPVAVEDLPGRHEPRQPDEVLAAFDALWPEAEEPLVPSAGVAADNISTQPDTQDHEGEDVAAFTGAASNDIPTQSEFAPAKAERAAVARDEPREERVRKPPARRKAAGVRPRRKRRS
jgi:hypothetical protein